MCGGDWQGRRRPTSLTLQVIVEVGQSGPRDHRVEFDPVDPGRRTRSRGTTSRLGCIASKDMRVRMVEEA